MSSSSEIQKLHDKLRVLKLTKCYILDNIALALYSLVVTPGNVLINLVS